MRARRCAATAGSRALALLVALAAWTSCRPALDAPKPAVEPVYRREDGRLTQIRYDANHNGTMDAVSHMDGTRVVRIEIDTDEDGTIDRWEYYGPTQALERVGFSRARNGRADTWAFADAAGRIVRVEAAPNGDGRVTRIEHYQGPALTGVEEDSDADGRIDRWESYADGRLVRLSFDPAGSGQPTHTLRYQADGTTDVASPDRRR